MKKSTKTTGLPINIVAVAVALASLAAAAYLVSQKTTFRPKATLDTIGFELVEDVPAVADRDDLTRQIDTLDGINLGQIDQALNKNSVDADQL